MAISDAEAIKFSNERIRPAADRLAKAYYKAQQTKDLWESMTGTNAEKLALIQPILEDTANRLNWTYRFCEETRLLWDALVMANLFPNDNTEEVWDNGSRTAPDQSRQAINGEDVRRINWTIEEYVNWCKYTPLVSTPVFLRDGQLTTEILGYDAIKDILKLASDGFGSPSGTQANNLITRCGELKTEWGTTNTNRLTWILKAGVNTNP